jgi:hypothetical protein
MVPANAGYGFPCSKLIVGSNHNMRIYLRPRWRVLNARHRLKKKAEKKEKKGALVSRDLFHLL